MSPPDLIRAIEQADSPARLVAAVQALAATRSEAGIPALIATLGYNNPGAAMAAVAGLVDLGEAAVIPLLAQLDTYNYGARAYAIRALATIADPRALDVLLNAAETDFAPSVRRAAAKGLGHLHWQRLPLAERQVAQEKALKTLLLIAQDPEWAIRYAAIVGLQAGLQVLSSASDSQISSTQVSLMDVSPPNSVISAALVQLAHLSQTESDRAVQARASLAHHCLMNQISL